MIYFSIRIDSGKSKKCFNDVSRILNLEPTHSEDHGWVYEITDENQAEGFSFISHFVELLEPHLPTLGTVGVLSNDITIWMLYEYDQQCNMEFSPNEMMSLAKNSMAFVFPAGSDKTLIITQKILAAY